MKEDNPANSISQSFKLTTPKNISFFYTLFFRLFPLLTFFLFILSCGNLPSNLGGTDVTVTDVGNVEGTVTDASAGALLSGVTVKIGDKSANTNNNGVYTITEVSVGSRTITAVKTGYQTYTDTVDIGKGTVATKNILLTPESGSDTTAPSNTTGSNFTNNGASSTNSISVTLSLSASDNVGVTGYYISESSTTPLCISNRLDNGYFYNNLFSRCIIYSKQWGWHKNNLCMVQGFSRECISSGR